MRRTTIFKFISMFPEPVLLLKSSPCAWMLSGCEVIVKVLKSAILILGVPAEMYTQGTMYYIYTVGYVGGGLLTSFIFVPLFYPLNLTSIYEYLELRYKSRSVKLVGSTISIIATLMFTGFASYAPATALEQVSGFPEWGSFIMIGVVCTCYTLLGGLKAVVWVDTFQAIIMIAGLFAIMIKAIMEVGDFDEVWRINDQWGRIQFWDFNPDPTVRHTFWTLTIASFVSSAGSIGCSQASVQRFCATKSLQEARKAVWVNLGGNVIMYTVACITGISLFAYYVKQGCDPISNGDVSNINQLVPHFVQELLGYPGIQGLFIACLFSGALSSVSSNLSSLCAQTWEDMLKPVLKMKTEEQKTKIVRLLVVIYGVVGIGMTFLTSNLTGTILQATMSFIGVGAGPLTGIVALGALFPWANWIGAITGSVLSYILMMWIGIGKYTIVGEPLVLDFPTSSCNLGNSNMTTALLTTMSTINATQQSVYHELSGLERLYSLSYLWYAGLGLVLCIGIGLLVSLITGPMDPKDVDKKYLISVCDWLCCCLPKSCRGCNNSARYGVSMNKDIPLKDVGDSKTGTDNPVYNGYGHDISLATMTTNRDEAIVHVKTKM
ncbi:sodium-coupled monocarboxylate transporter 1-like [Mizuhopecten yessoensis]|uniref:Sodium-coupled monocarboxylate transporter 1 n=1 Tax=Mizuhopecten yessoensis TaxID=6573 RepID=A0A210QIK9_MIZYE|nr:sodium-coupled monocarboxylate transporter 1-like [Mizuhopecten yessoensis]OWF48529.1 Sodium-coupled monocarboxylate transporter 1 [Mizuhopecten yessoensis]